MIQTAIDRLRYASPAFWRGVCVCGVALVVLYAVAAQARDAEGRYSGPIAKWFKEQHNEKGQWCCDESDGHRFDGDYKLNEDGSVTIHDAGQTYDLPSYMVLKGGNPTGGAVWWFTQDYHGKRTSYCFAPGSLT